MSLMLLVPQHDPPLTDRHTRPSVLLNSCPCTAGRPAGAQQLAAASASSLAGTSCFQGWAWGQRRCPRQPPRARTRDGGCILAHSAAAAAAAAEGLRRRCRHRQHRRGPGDCHAERAGACTSHVLLHYLVLHLVPMTACWPVQLYSRPTTTNALPKRHMALTS